MATDVFGPDVVTALLDAQAAAGNGRTRTVAVDGQPSRIASPFPSPADWRDCPLYFLLISHGWSRSSGRVTWCRTSSRSGWSRRSGQRDTPSSR